LWSQVASRVEAVLRGRRIAVYNAELQLRLVRQTNARYNMRWTVEDLEFFCLMKLYAPFHGKVD